LKELKQIDCYFLPSICTEQEVAVNQIPWVCCCAVYESWHILPEAN